MEFILSLGSLLLGYYDYEVSFSEELQAQDAFFWEHAVQKARVSSFEVDEVNLLAVLVDIDQFMVIYHLRHQRLVPTDLLNVQLGQYFALPVDVHRTHSTWSVTHNEHEGVIECRERMEDGALEGLLQFVSVLSDHQDGSTLKGNLSSPNIHLILLEMMRFLYITSYFWLRLILVLSKWINYFLFPI